MIIIRTIHNYVVNIQTPVGKKIFFSRNHNANMAGTFWFDNGGTKGFFHVKLEGMVLGNIFGGDEPPLPGMANLYHLNCLFKIGRNSECWIKMKINLNFYFSHFL